MSLLLFGPSSFRYSDFCFFSRSIIERKLFYPVRQGGHPMTFLITSSVFTFRVAFIFRYCFSWRLLTVLQLPPYVGFVRPSKREFTRMNEGGDWKYIDLSNSSLTQHDRPSFSMAHTYNITSVFEARSLAFLFSPLGVWAGFVRIAHAQSCTKPPERE
ncbi:hypothetical protein GALMADRAFT_933254 [Galerina marginata CBS 339.88]|uniref:Uncharacterized protein n=1 Tax=Galerina marginata (strain CBS 339.88) TaxID=685588 RepID=A0A067SMY2_GALM3|nr:hypothetical protein GALMADRAFT_933254 [Galerina marginata CBS 339.88]